MVENARDALVEAAPEAADDITQRAAALIGRLEAADAEIRALIDEIPEDRRKVVTDHDALGYFIDEYGLEFVGSVFPSLDVSSDPSAREIEELVERIRELDVPAIFPESAMNPQLAQAVAAETGARVSDEPLYTDSLGPPGSGAETLDGMLLHNARVIHDGLVGSLASALRTTGAGLASDGEHTNRFARGGDAEMASVVESIDVKAPVSTVYNQWTQFEDFPRFMEGVKSVTQIDDTHLHWVAEVAGKEKEWDAEITEQHPDERVAWSATSGAENAGVVTFHRIDDETTRVTLQLDADPDGLVENVGTALGFLERRVKGDLERFKEFIESRGTETGAWRGNVEAPVQR